MDRYLIRSNTKKFSDFTVDVSDELQLHDFIDRLSIGGGYSVFRHEASGGSGALTPPSLHSFKFHLKDTQRRYVSSFVVPHIKSTKSNIDLENFIKDRFYSSFDFGVDVDGFAVPPTKCDYVATYKGWKK